jgi:hypothetical protein
MHARADHIDHVSDLHARVLVLNTVWIRARETYGQRRRKARLGAASRMRTAYRCECRYAADWQQPLTAQ